MPENLTQTDFLNLSLNDLQQLATAGSPSKIWNYFIFDFVFLNLGSDAELNNAAAYFDLGPRLVVSESAGIYHYFSTRNNDFSNRDQKGRIIVQPFEFQYQIIGQNGYTGKLE